MKLPKIGTAKDLKAAFTSKGPPPTRGHNAVVARDNERMAKRAGREPLPPLVERPVGCATCGRTHTTLRTVSPERDAARLCNRCMLARGPQ